MLIESLDPLPAESDTKTSPFEDSDNLLPEAERLEIEKTILQILLPLNDPKLNDETRAQGAIAARDAILNYAGRYEGGDTNKFVRRFLTVLDITGRYWPSGKVSIIRSLHLAYVWKQTDTPLYGWASLVAFHAETFRLENSIKAPLIHQYLFEFITFIERKKAKNTHGAHTGKQEPVQPEKVIAQYVAESIKTVGEAQKQVHLSGMLLFLLAVESDEDLSKCKSALGYFEMMYESIKENGVDYVPLAVVRSILTDDRTALIALGATTPVNTMIGIQAYLEGVCLAYHISKQDSANREAIIRYYSKKRFGRNDEAVWELYDMSRAHAERAFGRGQSLPASDRDMAIDSFSEGFLNGFNHLMPETLLNPGRAFGYAQQSGRNAASKTLTRALKVGKAEYKEAERKGAERKAKEVEVINRRDEVETREDLDWHIPVRISDELWMQIKSLLPPEKPKSKGSKGGRPRMPDRQALEAIFYKMRTKCKWKSLPAVYGRASTVHDRYSYWKSEGALDRISALIDLDLKPRGFKPRGFKP